MAGYHNFSMSNNAVAAYESGEAPLSKWNKKKIFEAIQEEEVELKCSVELLKRLPVKALKEMCLRCTSWHHTSNHYNKTDFYSLDVDFLEKLTDERIKEEIEESKSTLKKSKEETGEVWKCAFLEWSGTRKHPHATEHVEIGIVKGNWFYRKDGSKKSVNANGFEFIEKIQ